MTTTANRADLLVDFAIRRNLTAKESIALPSVVDRTLAEIRRHGSTMSLGDLLADGPFADFIASTCCKVDVDKALGEEVAS